MLWKRYSNETRRRRRSCCCYRVVCTTSKAVFAVASTSRRRAGGLDAAADGDELAAGLLANCVATLIIALPSLILRTDWHGHATGEPQQRTRREGQAGRVHPARHPLLSLCSCLTRRQYLRGSSSRLSTQMTLAENKSSTRPPRRTSRPPKKIITAITDA